MRAGMSVCAPAPFIVQQPQFLEDFFLFVFYILYISLKHLFSRPINISVFRELAEFTYYPKSSE